MGRHGVREMKVHYGRLYSVYLSMKKHAFVFNGLGVREAARLFGVSPALASSIRSEKRWEDVPFFN